MHHSNIATAQKWIVREATTNMTASHEVANVNLPISTNLGFEASTYVSNPTSAKMSGTMATSIQSAMRAARTGLA